jgi:hypothetical protein
MKQEEATGLTGSSSLNASIAKYGNFNAAVYVDFYGIV